jgi:hypothetical protein
MENNLFNGRVNLLSNSESEFDYVKNTDDISDGHDIVSRNLEHTPISSLFFSKLNINSLQHGISNKVFNESNGEYNIGRQSDIELKIVMRSIYLSSLNSVSRSIIEVVIPPNTNDRNYVLERVRELNKEVLDWVVPRILTNMQQFKKYKSDIQTLPTPMERPSYLSNTGTRASEFQSFF